jgi:hypothetical protein
MTSELTLGEVPLNLNIELVYSNGLAWHEGALVLVLGILNVRVGMHISQEMKGGLVGSRNVVDQSQ